MSSATDTAKEPTYQPYYLHFLHQLGLPEDAPTSRTLTREYMAWIQRSWTDFDEAHPGSERSLSRSAFHTWLEYRCGCVGAGL